MVPNYVTHIHPDDFCFKKFQNFHTSNFLERSCHFGNRIPTVLLTTQKFGDLFALRLKAILEGIRFSKTTFWGNGWGRSEMTRWVFLKVEIHRTRITLLLGKPISFRSPVLSQTRKGDEPKLTDHFRLTIHSQNVRCNGCYRTLIKSYHLFIAGILHHLGCTKPQTWWTVARFLPSTVCQFNDLELINAGWCTGHSEFPPDSCISPINHGIDPYWQWMMNSRGKVH